MNSTLSLHQERPTLTIDLTDPAEVRASLAHDVANGFAAITGAGDLLVEHWANMTEGQRADMLDIVTTGTHRLALVFTALLDELPDDLTARARALLDTAAASPRRGSRHSR